MLLLLLQAVFGKDGFRLCEAFMTVCLDSDATILLEDILCCIRVLRNETVASRYDSHNGFPVKPDFTRRRTQKIFIPTASIVGPAASVGGRVQDDAQIAARLALTAPCVCTQ